MSRSFGREHDADVRAAADAAAVYDALGPASPPYRPSEPHLARHDAHELYEQALQPEAPAHHAGTPAAAAGAQDLSLSHSNSLSSSDARAPASDAGMPPNYASRTDLSSAYSALDKGKAPSPPSTSQAPTALHPHVVPSGAAVPRNGPRIAVTDPLADMRSRNLSHPEGLGARSDLPRNMRLDLQRAAAAAAAADGLPQSSSGAPPVRPGMSRRDSNASSIEGEEDTQFDDFDWSDDEGLEDSAKLEEEEQRRLDLLKKRRGRLAPSKVIRWLFTSFAGNFILSASLAVPAIVIQYVYRPQGGVEESAPDAAHRDFVADNIQAWFTWAALGLFVSWILHAFVEILPAAFIALVRLAWGNVSQRILSFAEFYDAIKYWIKMVFYAAWSWGSWALIFGRIWGLYSQQNPATESRAAYLYRIYQVVEFFFFLILIISVEQILVKSIALSFHRSAFAERISEVTKALETVDRLKDYRPKLYPTHGKAGSTFGLAGSTFGMRTGARTPGRSPMMAYVEDEYAGDHEGGAATPRSTSGGKSGFWSKKHAQKRPAPTVMPTPDDAAGTLPAHGTSRSAPPSTPKTAVGRAVANGASTVRSKAATASQLARIAMDDPFNLLKQSSVGQVAADVNSPAEAKRLARSIFTAFRGHHKRSYLVPSDFNAAFKTPEEARAAFSIFDRDANGDISASEIKTTIISTYKERRFLTRSMQDVHHAVNQLDRILLCIAAIILLFVGLAIFNIEVGSSLTTFYSLAIAGAFIFKETFSNVFDSIVFIFVTHPYDTGDRICLGEDVMSVKKMSLLSSEFTLWNGTNIYIANELLSQMLIVNYRRSGYQWESATMQVAYDTPLETLDAVQADLIHWLQTEPERMFEPSTAIVPQSIDYMRSIEVTIGMTQRANWQDWGARWARRNAFFAALTYYMKKHGVRFTAANQPIVYWADDAAQLPPTYEGSAAAPRAADGEADGDGIGMRYTLQDDFQPSPPPSPTTAAAQAATSGGATPAATSGTTTPRAPPAPKPKAYMGFTPPADELDGTAGMRMRRARTKRGAFAMQGGDG